MLSLDAELAELKAHEERVAAFLASVPKRKRERVLAKYAVLEGRRMRRMLEQERCWASDLFNEITVASDVIKGGRGGVVRTSAKSEPGFEDDYSPRKTETAACSNSTREKAMRQGQVFRRCSSCGAKVEGKRCSCGNERFSWAYVVDVAPAGAKREQRKKGGYLTKAAALTAMGELQTAKAAGTYVESSRVTVGRYLEQWLAARARIRDTTRRDYRGSITKHINPRLGEVQLQTLSRLQVKGLYQQLATKGLGEKSIHNVHIALRKALQDALEDGLVRRNVADRAHAKPKDRPEMKTWSADELATFLAFTAQDPDLALFRVAAASGMRRGELLGLRWRDVDLESTRLNVRQQLSRHTSGWDFGPPKSAKSVRTIDLDPETVEVLREKKERRLFERRAWGDAYRSDLDLVFCQADGSGEDPDSVGRRFVRRVKQLRTVPAIALHGLRHTHATLLLEEGVDVKTVSERLGHDSIQTTLEIYGHVTPKMRGNAAARFGSLLSRARLTPVEQEISLLH